MTSVMPACFVVDPALGLYEQTMQVIVEDRQYGVSTVGDGKPMVCFHGFSQTSHTWDAIHIDNRQMVRVDWLGHGRSSKPEAVEPYATNAMLADVHCLLQAYVGPRYDLMGYSMGARMALLYSLTYPDAVTHLILESGSCGIEDEAVRTHRRRRDEQLAQTLLAHDGVWFADYWRQLPIFETQKRLPQAVQHLLWRRCAHNDMRGLANALIMTGQGVMPYVGHRLGTLSMPSLYICGDLDDKYKQVGQTYFAPYMPVQVISDAGHTVHLEQTERFTEVVNRWLYTTQ